MKSSGTTFPKVTLSRSCWLLQTRSGGSGGTLSQPSCNQHRASPRPKLRHLNMSWLRKNLSSTKPALTRGSLRKKLQRSTETVEKLRKQLQAEQDILGRLVPALSQGKEATKQSLDGLRAMRIAVHGAGADGDKNAPRPAPTEQDTDMFKQNIRLFNESAKRARTESNVDHSAVLECIDGLLGEPNALFLKNANTSGIIDIDPCLRRRVVFGKSNKFGAEGNSRCCWQHRPVCFPQRTIFRNHQPRTKLLDSCSARCMSKSKGWPT